MVELTIMIINMAANRTIPIMIASACDSTSPIDRNLTFTDTKDVVVLTAECIVLYRVGYVDQHFIRYVLVLF